MSLENDPELTKVRMDFHNTSFVSGGLPGEDRIRLQYFFRERDGHFFAEISTGKYAEGPPGHVHGGAMAGILDEAMGVMVWYNRHPVLTAKLNVDFRKPLPLGLAVVMESRIERIEGRKVYAYGEIRREDTIYASGTGLFVKMPLEKFPEMERAALKRRYRL
ncbi:MAG: PaaI family thioesterase [Oligoflexia bacterium]|nr:PaaI family thioesterase [Oligoflexia bacterium]